jgi:KTSC domain
MGQMSDARVVIVSWVFAATWVAVAWLWTPTLSEPAPSTSDQPVVTGAISPAPMPAGDEDRPVEFPAIPVIAQAEPRSDSEPVPPQLEAEPSSVLPDSHQTLNVPRAAPEANQLPSHLPLLAEASRAVPRESEAPLLLPPMPKGSNVFDDFGKPAPKLVQAEGGIACPPRDTLENAQAWVHERLKCERHPTPNGPWIEWAEYCPSGPLGYFVLKVKTGQQTIYLFENIPPTVWEGFKAAPSADKFYHSEIKGKHHWFRLGRQLKPSAPELTCHR